MIRRRWLRAFDSGRRPTVLLRLEALEDRPTPSGWMPQTLGTTQYLQGV